uniref:Uncharacterized protein n=1 Tax=Anguilla anguilla TaxID=7936 RepID=A0A0E9WDM0_ANGAN
MQWLTKWALDSSISMCASGCLVYFYLFIYSGNNYYVLFTGNHILYMHTI